MPPGGVARAMAALCAPFALHATEPAAPPSSLDIIQSFAAQVTKLDTQDPRDPQALETHLRYADYLANAQGEQCADRLKAAQSQLQAVRQNLALSVVLPQGLARAADIEYQIHTALAACGDSSDASHRDLELHAALTCAQQAAALYRDDFDYPAAVTMQFNAALTTRGLGDNDAAQAALQSVIEADREYGFRDDALENYQLLLNWKQADTGADQAAVAALMQDFPQRSTTLKFAWISGDNAISLKTQSARVIGNAVIHASGDRTLQRRVRARPFGWIVTHQSLGSHFSIEPLQGTDAEQFMTSFLAMLLQFHDFSLTDVPASTFGTGVDFNETINRDSFKVHAQQQANSLLGALASPLPPAALLSTVNARMNDLLRPAAVGAATALAYNLQTGTWPGASLEQGQWYGMKLSLPLPYAPLNFVRHQVQFAFTRELPCPGNSARPCVEIVLRAIPEEPDLQHTLQRLQAPLRLPHAAALHAWSTFSMRLITDPLTLQAYSGDTRQQFYVSLGSAASDARVGSDETLIDSGPIKPSSD